MPLDLRLSEDALGNAVVSLRGELDVYTVRPFQEATDHLQVGAGRLTIDLTGLSFIDSSGLSALVRLAGDRTPTLVCPTTRMVTLFAMTGLERLFVIVRKPSSNAREPGDP